MTTLDLQFLISENYMALLILGGLLVMMYAYKEVRLPASKTFLLIATVLLLLCISDSLESWAILSPDRRNIRTIASIFHYILQPLVIYLELIVLMPNGKGKNHLPLLSLPLAINTLIYLAAPLTDKLVFWYDDGYAFHRGPLGTSIYIVTFLYLGLLLYSAINTFHAHDKKLSIVLFFMVAIAILTGALEGFNLAPGFIDEAIAFGVFLFYTYLITVHEAETRASLITKDLALSQSELKLLRQQIRPHFVFNSLHIIKSLIRKDPAKATDTLAHFSEYLRANFDAITSDGLVSFEEELDNIKAYAALALADESKGINMIYDTDELYFRIPPLSIEPFVENAIKHGLVEGGTITVSSKNEGDAYVVTVSDDGVGFDPGETKVEQVREGIGIANAKTRLEKTCKGTLDIKSGSFGTQVTIRIPKEKA